MDSETEVIRQQMEGTRTALTEKLERLETQVADKVQQTTTTMADTVQAVSNTVENVKETVEGTVDAVKHTFDIQWHAKHHPWMLMGGAVALGFVGGCLLSRGRRSRSFHGQALPPPPSYQPKPQQSSSGGILGALGNFGQEFLDLKKLGIGMAMGVLREVVSHAVPTQFGQTVGHVVNNFTERLGGQPLGDSQEDHASTTDSGSQDKRGP